MLFDHATSLFFTSYYHLNLQIGLLYKSDHFQRNEAKSSFSVYQFLFLIDDNKFILSMSDFL